MPARGDQYHQAIQNPRLAFDDPDLKVCSPETDPLGLPRPYSGGFTTTYHLKNHNQHWAARCFTREIPDVRRRYRDISRFLRQNSSDFFVKADYLKKGIRVDGQWYPIVKMEWVRGVPINSFIQTNLPHPRKIAGLPSEFLAMVRELEELKIAHGDLQHGNIIVKNGRLYLVDYDGMFVPGLRGLKASELGHIDYQHPARTEEHFDASIDRFSSIVIYLALRAISLEPSLWRKYDNSDNLLFRSEDFRDIRGSQLIAELASLPELSTFIARFKKVCCLELAAVPTLDQFIHGDMPHEPDAHAAPVYKRRSQYPIIDATDVGALTRAIGTKVEVVGEITDSHSGIDKYGRPYVFLNFGKFPYQTLTFVVWPRALRTFEDANADPIDYVNRRVQAVGVVGQHKNRVQIELRHPSQIRVLPAEEKAKHIHSDEHSLDALTQLYQTEAAARQTTAARKASIAGTQRPDLDGRPVSSGKADSGDIDKESISILNALYGSGPTGASRSPSTHPAPRPAGSSTRTSGGRPSASGQSAPKPAGPPSKSPTSGARRASSALVFLAVAALVILATLVGLLNSLSTTQKAQPMIVGTITAIRTEVPTSTVVPSPTAVPSSEPTAPPELTVVPVPTADVSGCTLEAVFQADITIPDDSQVQAGEVFTKTWLIRNAGTCAWGPAYRFVYVQGEKMNGSDSVPVSRTAPGEATEISVVMVGPEEPGQHRGYWRMCVNGSEFFGDRLYVQVRVVDQR